MKITIKNEEKEFSSNVFITKIVYSVRFRDRIEVPPFTSKVTKAIMIKINPNFEPILKKGEPDKNLIFSLLYLNDKPLFGLKKLKLKKEAPYQFEFVYIGDFPEELVGSWNIKILNTEADITTIYVKSFTFDKIGLTPSDFYLANFKTPTLLQIPSGRRDKKIYYLFPEPFLVYFTLVRHWNKYAPNRLKIPFFQNPLEVWSKLFVTDFRLKPVDVIYSEKPFRAFMGKVVFKVEDDLKDIVRKLFSYANFVGIGKSRTIGFGMVDIKPWHKSKL